MIWGDLSSLLCEMGYIKDIQEMRRIIKKVRVILIGMRLVPSSLNIYIAV